MSYVLDALRKADAERERERGDVPGLHSNPLPPSAFEPAVRAALPPWVWIGGVAGLLLIAAMAWLLLQRPAARDEIDDVRIARSTTAPASVVPVVPAAPAMIAPDAASATAMPATTPTPAVTAPARAPARLPARASSALPASTASASPASAHAVLAAKSAASAPGVAARASGPVAAERVVALNELPEAVRRELPKLAVGGSMYSDDPAARLVIINGQPYRERDKVAAGLVLVQLLPQAAVFEFKGQRFRLSY